MNDRISFVKAILAGDYHTTPGVFADWLEENGDAATGLLLRKRWRRFLSTYHRAELIDQADEAAICGPWIATLEQLKANGAVVVGERIEAVVRTERSKVCETFRMYIRERFPQECYEASDPTNSQAYKDS